MVWRNTARVGGAALAVAASMVAANPAHAQERVLAGIRLNTSSQNVIAKYGNPSLVVVGEVGVRAPGPAGGAQGGFGAGGAGGGAGFPGAPGGYPGAPGGFGGAPEADFPGGGGTSPFPAGPGFGGPTGAPGFSGPSGAPGFSGYGGGGGFGGGLPQVGGGRRGPGGVGLPGAAGFGGGGMSDMPGGGFPGGGDMPGGFGGFGGVPGAAGGGVGAFGQTTSTLSRQQEVTWIYNRPGGISYEFLIGPNGKVIQIKAIGYNGGSARTARGIGLGAPYSRVVQKYGYPEEHQRVGPVLVASFRKRANLSFQFLDEKVIAITIASVE